MASKEVLFIHDRITISEVIQAGFDQEDVASWNISIVTSFESTLIKIILNPPDLIILDWEFSQIEGVEILKAIRNYLNCYTPVVVFISKPLTAEEQYILTQLDVLKIIYKGFSPLCPHPGF